MAVADDPVEQTLSWAGDSLNLSPQRDVSARSW